MRTSHSPKNLLGLKASKGTPKPPFCVIRVFFSNAQCEDTLLWMYSLNPLCRILISYSFPTVFKNSRLFSFQEMPHARFIDNYVKCSFVFSKFDCFSFLSLFLFHPILQHFNICFGSFPPLSPSENIFLQSLD